MQQRSGRWVLAARGGSPREGGYTFKKLDEDSGLLLDGGEEVARVICKSLSHEELKWTKFGHDLTGVTITKSEVMQEMQKASNEGAYFVLPSQLNGVDAPSPERVLKSLEECKSDAMLFERRGIRGHLALHPAVSQFLLDNARGTSRGCGLNSVGKVLESINSDRVEFQNGYLRVGPESEESLRVLVANLHKTQPLILEDVPVVGLQHSKLFTSSFHLVHLAFASACPLDQRHRSDNFHEELSRSILSVQYLGALRRAAEKAAENARRKQKVFLVPPGDPGEQYFHSRISESMSRAVALLGPEDFKKLEVHILLEESDFDEFCSELMFYGVNLCS